MIRKFYFDSREKKNDHIKAYFERHGIQFKVQKLDEGDYQIEGKPDRTVDRKQNMQEMYNCVVNDKSRFMREVRRCYEKNIKLYVLIEHGGQIKSLSDVPKWNPKCGTISSSEIAERLYRLHISYGVEFLFCDKRSTGKRIVELLQGWDVPQTLPGDTLSGGKRDFDEYVGWRLKGWLIWWENNLHTQIRGLF